MEIFNGLKVVVREVKSFIDKVIAALKSDLAKKIYAGLAALVWLVYLVITVIWALKVPSYIFLILDLCVCGFAVPQLVRWIKAAFFKQ